MWCPRLFFYSFQAAMLYKAMPYTFLIHLLFLSTLVEYKRSREYCVYALLDEHHRWNNTLTSTLSSLNHIYIYICTYNCDCFAFIFRIILLHSFFILAAWTYLCCRGSALAVDTEEHGLQSSAQKHYKYTETMHTLR